MATAVEQGIDRLLGLDKVKLQLGVLDTMPAGAGLRAGHYVGIAADESNIKADRLWIREGRLRHGEDPVTATAFSSHYMVVQIETPEHNANWPALANLMPFEAEFQRILGDSHLAGDELRAELAKAWPKFAAALAASPELIPSDRELIREDVAADLERRRRARESPNPYVETRSLEGGTEEAPAAAFDFAEVAFARELGERSPSLAADVNPFA